MQRADPTRFAIVCLVSVGLALAGCFEADQPPLAPDAKPAADADLAATDVPSSAGGPLVTGLQGASGSTVRPGGALFVTEGAAGRILLRTAVTSSSS